MANCAWIRRAIRTVGCIVWCLVTVSSAAGAEEANAIIVDLGLGPAVPRQLGVNAYTGEFVIAADEGFDAVDDSQWLSGERPVVISRVSLFRKRDGSWEPGFGKGTPCGDPLCKRVNLERGRFDASGTELCATTRGGGGDGSILFDLRHPQYYRSWVSSTKGALACGVGNGARRIINVTAKGVDVETFLGTNGGDIGRLSIPFPPGTALAKAVPVVPAPSGEMIAVGVGAGIALVVPAGSGAPQLLSGFSEAVAQIAWSGDGRKVAAGSLGGEVGVWSAEDGEALWIRPVHGKKEVTGLVMTPRGDAVVSVGGDNTLLLLSGFDGMEKLRYKSRRGLRGAAIHPDSGAVATLEKASGMTKVGLGSTSIGLHILLPQENPALAELYKEDPLAPIPGLNRDEEIWARMRICSRILESIDKARKKAQVASTAEVAALKRTEFETAGEFDVRRQQVREAAVNKALGPAAGKSEEQANECVRELGTTSLVATATITLKTYDMERSQFPFTFVVHSPGPPFSGEGALGVEREEARRIREKANLYLATIRYRLTLPGAPQPQGLRYEGILGIERFGVAIEGIQLTDPDFAGVPAAVVATIWE